MRKIETYVENIKYTDGYENIMTVEHRSNNSKRDFLFCNKIQGKHIPAKPSYVFRMINDLVRKVIGDKLEGHKVVVVGFAETATALGHILADNLYECVYYLQTTRENCEPEKRLIEFEEEHSHATEQYLFGNIEDIPEFDYILFVDDEISTGKTILNFIDKFNSIKKGDALKFGVASICNWQNTLDREEFTRRGIDTFALITGHLKDAKAKMGVKDSDIEDMPEYSGDVNNVTSYDTDSEMYVCYNSDSVESKSAFIKERSGIDVVNDMAYKSLVRRLETEADAYSSMYNISGRKVLVLGVEECMYLPLRFALALEKNGARVRFHATSRSSIDIIKALDASDITEDAIYNKLIMKYKLHSLYDKDRVTYIYNLKRYDKVFILSDKTQNKAFNVDIVSALVSVGNKPEDIVNIQF